MRKLVLGTLAALALGSAMMATTPAEARCFWNGYAWECFHHSHHWRHHHHRWDHHWR